MLHIIPHWVAPQFFYSVYRKNIDVVISAMNSVISMTNKGFSWLRMALWLVTVHIRLLSMLKHALWCIFWQIFCIVSIISNYTQVLHDKLQWYASSLAKLKEILIVNIILQSRVKINYTTVLKITAKMLRTATKGRNHQWNAQKMRLRTHSENLKNLCRCIKCRS